MPDIATNPTEATTFSLGDFILRAVIFDSEPWFVLADALAALELDRTASRRLDDDEKGVAVIHTPGGPQQVATVNEAGLFSLILGSRKPEARAFKRWVTHEVLPEIRRSGSFVVESPEQLLARALVQAKDTLDRKDEQIRQLSPRAEAWDAIASAEGDYSVGDAAKMLARAGFPTGPQRLFTYLEQIKWTYRGSDGRPRAYAERVETGHLAEKPSFHYHPGTGERVVDPPQVRVTLKGVERLRLRMQSKMQAVSA